MAGSQAGFLSCWRLSGAATRGEGWRDHKSMHTHAAQEEWEGFIERRRHQNTVWSLILKSLACRDQEWGVSRNGGLALLIWPVFVVWDVFSLCVGPFMSS